ncbi:hypothetical protein DMUE_1956 [Dictyocoela muelleri]|nr:hypothetical protein DMUE_1956 [Dictyocoela muelleri]
MLSFLFILMIPIKSTFYQKIIKSSPTRCILELKSTFPGSQKLEIRYPDCLIPDFKHYEDNILILNFNNEFTIHLSFRKILFKTYEYYGNIEKGYIFPPSLLIIGDEVMISESILDNILVPDFTVPFIAFNTCATVILCVISIIFRLIERA